MNETHRTVPWKTHQLIPTVFINYGICMYSGLNEIIETVFFFISG